jgi:hypothetical protein
MYTFVSGLATSCYDAGERPLPTVHFDGTPDADPCHGGFRSPHGRPLPKVHRQRGLAKATLTSVSPDIVLHASRHARPEYAIR